MQSGHGTKAQVGSLVARSNWALAAKRQDGERVRGAGGLFGKHTSLVVEPARR